MPWLDLVHDHAHRSNYGLLSLSSVERLDDDQLVVVLQVALRSPSATPRGRPIRLYEGTATLIEGLSP